MRSLCVICGPIVIATRGRIPAGSVGVRVPRLGAEPIGLIPCRACDGQGVVTLRSR